MSVNRDTIRTIMNSKQGQILPSPASVSGMTTLISAGQTVADFRAIVTQAQDSDNGLLVYPDAMKKLEVETGETLRYWVQKTRRAAKPNTSQIVAYN
jgi:arginine/ornithine N-succinyltransferase beta subunit